MRLSTFYYMQAVKELRSQTEQNILQCNKMSTQTNMHVLVQAHIHNVYVCITHAHTYSTEMNLNPVQGGPPPLCVQSTYNYKSKVPVN